jgi:N-acetylglucosaminyldiphosphoundecaprenol N-acetyl-beta-D-mannosaminyltransferase
MADRAIVLGCPVDRLDADAVMARVEERLADGQPTTLGTVTAARLVAMQRDAELRQVVEAMDLVSAGDRNVALAARLRRVDPNALMGRLLELAARDGRNVYVLGGTFEAIDRALFVAYDRYPGLQVAGHHHGYFQADDESRVADEIRDAAPDVLFVALPSPRAEYWIGRYGAYVGAAVTMVAREDWTDALVSRPERRWRGAMATNARFAGLLARAATGRAEPLEDRRAADRRATDRRRREAPAGAERRRQDRRGSDRDPRGRGAR